ncbi:PLP-dependent aminotransferase family protein [Fusobacterium necrophorum subsp. funduliforme]
MMIFPLDNNSKTPLYIQMYTEIKKQIQNGNFCTDEKLPSKKNFMEHYHISQSTVQNALYLLLEEGYIYSIERRGYFVSNVENMVTTPFLCEHKAKEENIEKIEYDFAYSGVDARSIPKTIFKRITRDIYEEQNEDLLFQGDIQGYFPLRESICQYLVNSRGFSVNPSQIIISSGIEYLFYIIFKIFEKKIYGLENPGYRLLRELFASNQIEFYPISLDESGIMVEELKKRRIQIACITPSHQFPTGVIMPIQRRNELLHWANSSEEHYIVEDDYDSEFKYNGRPIPALKAIDQKDKVIYMGSFSKSISPAIRVSYMVLSKNLLNIYEKKLPYFICPVSTLSQKILYKFIAEGHFVKHLNRMRTLYKQKREFVVQCFKKTNITILGADAGLHLLLSFPYFLDEEKFLEECRKHYVRIYSIREYYFQDKPSQNSIFLLGYASLQKEQIQEGISILLKLLEKHKHIL